MHPDAPSGWPQQRGSWFGLFVCLVEADSILLSFPGKYFRGTPPFWSPVPPTGGSEQCQDSSLSTCIATEHHQLSLFLQRRSQRMGSDSDPTRERPVKAVVRKIPMGFFPFSFSLIFFLLLYKNNQNTCNTLVKGSERERKLQLKKSAPAVQLPML